MSVESQGSPPGHINVRRLCFFQLSSSTSPAMDPDKSPKLTRSFSLSPGLNDQDTRLDVLQEHFWMLQNCTVECANPDVDLLTFALSTHSFSVVMMSERVVSERRPADEPQDYADTQCRRAQDESDAFDTDVSPSNHFAYISLTLHCRECNLCPTQSPMKNRSSRHIGGPLPTRIGGKWTSWTNGRLDC